MDLSSPGLGEKQEHAETNRLDNDWNTSSSSSPSLSGSSSSSPLLTSSSTGSSWYKLQLGAKPVKISRKEWMCSQDCKKKNKAAIFKDSQAVEKHILRNHPDPIYNEFVCLFAWCKMARTSPQQILDHLGQSEKYDGHELKDQQLKYESIRALHKKSKEKYRVVRDRKEFAWYIYVPQEEARLLCPGVAVANSKDTKTSNQYSANRVESSAGEQTSRSEEMGNPKQGEHSHPKQQQHYQLHQLQLQPQQQQLPLKQQPQPEQQLQQQKQQQQINALQLQPHPQPQQKLQLHPQQQLLTDVRPHVHPHGQDQLGPKHGRPPDVAHKQNSRHLDPGKMLTGGFSAVPG